jgi:hypothetical protein
MRIPTILFLFICLSAFAAPPGSWQGPLVATNASGTNTITQTGQTNQVNGSVVYAQDRNGNVTVGGTFTSAGTATLDGLLGVTGVATLSGGFQSYANSSVAGTLTATALNGSGAGLTANTIPLASLANGTPNYIPVRNSSGVMVETNTLNFNLLVGGIAANYQVTNWPHSIWVSPSGSDSLNNGTNSLSPFATLTNAIALVEAIGGSNVIHLEQGSFPFPASTYIPSNTCIVGTGEDATYLVPPIAANAIGLVINSNNILIKDLTIGTNTGNGSFYFPLVPTGGTNVVFMGVKVIGDSDGVYAGGVALITNAFYGTFINCIFKTDYDCVTVGGTGNGTNSLLQFIGCTFTNTIGTDFVNQNRRCIVVGQNSGGSFPVSVQVQGCIFSSSNNSSLGFVTSIEVNNPNSVAQVSGNIYNFTNASTGGAYGAYIATGTLNVVGGIDPNAIDNVGGAINYATNQFASLASTPLNPSALTGAGTIPTAAYGLIPAINLDTSLGCLVLTNVNHNCQYYTNISCTSGTARLFGGPFTASQVGQTVIWIASASQQIYTITSFLSANTVGVNVTPGSTQTNQFGAIGTDDSQQINATISNAVVLGMHTIIAPPGMYLLTNLYQLPYEGAYAAIVVPMTNLSLATNSSYALKIMGMEPPFPNLNWTSTGNQPINTNGAIFCCPMWPGPGTNLTSCCMIGVPLSPGAAFSFGFVGLNLYLENLTFRSFPGDPYAGINLGHVAGCNLNNLAVDVGTDLSFINDPSVMANANVGIIFPYLNNWSTVKADNVSVVGYDYGYQISEHLQAGNLYAYLDKAGIQFLQGFHKNYIGKFTIGASTTHMYNAGVENTTVIGVYDPELDETLVPVWAKYTNSIVDTGNFQRGCAPYSATTQAGLDCLITNNGGYRFNMPPLHPELVTPFSITATGYTNILSMPLDVFINASSTAIAISNCNPTLVFGPITVTGPLCRRLGPFDTITNTSATLYISASAF